MNFLLKSSSAIVATSILLAGCASHELQTKGTQASQAGYTMFNVVNLQSTGEQGYRGWSDAMQLMYLYSGKGIKYANDLVRYQPPQSFNAFSTGMQLTNAARWFADSISTFELLSLNAIFTKSSREVPTPDYTENLLISVVPISDTTPGSLQVVVDKAHQEQIDAVVSVYNQHGFKSFVVNEGIEVNWNNYANRTYIAPVDEDGNSALCDKKDAWETMKAKQGAANGYIEQVRCYAYTTTKYRVFKGSADNENAGIIVPKSGDFMLVSTRLPKYFPVNDLETTSKNMYLYQPPFDYLADLYFKDSLKKQKEDFEFIGSKGGYTPIPLVTHISEKRILTF